MRSDRPLSLSSAPGVPSPAAAPPLSAGDGEKRHKHNEKGNGAAGYIMRPSLGKLGFVLSRVKIRKS